MNQVKFQKVNIRRAKSKQTAELILFDSALTLVTITKRNGKHTLGFSIITAHMNKIA